jgi:hypothetical protein
MNRALAAALAGLAVAAIGGCSQTTAYIRHTLESAPVASPLKYRLVLVGDAGEPKSPEPVLEAARAWAATPPGLAHVVFLGDNAYPRGVVPEDAAQSKERLSRQIEELKSAGAQIVFVPGNHDWDRGGRRGVDAIKEQEAFVESRGAEFMPVAGCAGPATVDLPSTAAVIRLVVLDTQWWLHKHDKGSGCTPDTENGVIAELRQALETDLPVVIAAHHPLATHGPHGGFNDWKAWLFPATEWRRWLWLPTPGVGLLRPFVVRSDQDLVGRRNKRMVERLNDVLRAPRPALTVFAAGHEHSLQVLTGVSADYVLVSGAGSSRHSTRVGKGDDTLFAHQRDGFMVLDVLEAGVRLSIVDPGAPSADSAMQFMLPRRRSPARDGSEREAANGRE